MEDTSVTSREVRRCHRGIKGNDYSIEKKRVSAKGSNTGTEFKKTSLGVWKPYSDTVG